MSDHDPLCPARCAVASVTPACDEVCESCNGAECLCDLIGIAAMRGASDLIDAGAWLKWSGPWEWLDDGKRDVVLRMPSDDRYVRALVDAMNEWFDKGADIRIGVFAFEREAQR